MLRSLTVRQLRDWERFNAVEPIGDVRGDVQAAVIAQAAVAPYVKKGKAPTLQDFMPFAEKDEEDTPRERILRNFRRYGLNYSGAKDRTPSGRE